jgi:Periplasmic binding protein
MSATASPTPSVVLPVLSADSAGAVDGMRLAAGETGIGLEVTDPGADPVSALRAAVESRPPAVLVVDRPETITAARPEIETAGVPVVLVGGDLYSSRSLFRHAFQVSVPLAWQARVLAHYLATDRRYEAVAIAGPDPGGVLAAALAEEGLQPAGGVSDAEAILTAAAHPSPGAPADAQLALFSGALERTGDVPGGAVACAPYTWAGWADMIPRVHAFRERFADRFGRDPLGSEQEGYEAVRALAEAIARTGGRGGDALIRALETFREETYSSIPIRLGPDDHVLAEQSQLGLFTTVAGSEEKPSSGEAIGPLPWRALMRTFTTDGRRVNLLDRDKRIFFPGWRPKEPSPYFWRSRFGIVTRSDEDPLH